MFFFSFKMALNLRYSVQVLPCWFGASEDRTRLCEVPPKTNFLETISGFLCVSTFCVLFHMSDAIYFKSPIDKVSFDVKMSECNRSSTRFNHLLGLLLYSYYLCACVSAKGRVFLAHAVALHEYFPLRLADVAWLVHWGGGGIEGAYTLMGYQGTRCQSPETHRLHTSQPAAVVKTHTSSDILFQIYYHQTEIHSQLG